VSRTWPTVALGDVSSIAYGFTDSACYEPVGPKFLRITDIQDEGVEWSDVPYCSIGSAELHKHLLQDNDIVFARTGATTGKSFLVRNPPEAVPASYLIRLRIFDARVSPEYLALFFQTDAYWRAIREGTSGSAQGGFNASKLAALEVPLPPIEEQRRIVAVLYKAFAAIAAAAANADKNLGNARELFSSYLRLAGSGACTGKRLRIRDCATVISGQHIDAKDYNTTGDGIGYLTGPSDFGEVYPTVSKWTLVPKRTALAGDILITVKGSGVGSINRMPGKELAISRQLMAVRTNGYPADLIYFALESGFDHFQRLANGAAIPGISRTDVLDFEFGVAGDDEIGSFLDKLILVRQASSDLANQARAKLEQLAAFKQSLLRRAFSGEPIGTQLLAA
jgi:type I restriction enzyme S subunit